MTPQQAQFDADVAAVEGDALVTFVFNGKEYIGQRTSIKSQLMMVDAGFEQAFDFILSVRASQFSGEGEIPPVETDVLTIKGDDTEYRVLSAEPDQLGVVINYAMKQNT